MRHPSLDRHVPAPWRVLIALALALAAMPLARAQAIVVAVDPNGASAPVLWNGGVAWLDPEGVHAATPGSAPRRLVSYRARGFTYGFSLDSGSGSGGAAGAGAVLAYGWEEANEMTPPMGPGDTSIPPPPLPYETSILRRGLVGADGHVTQLPSCGTEDEPVGFGAYRVSLGAPAVAYRCQGVPSGATAPTGAILPSYLALSEIATPGNVARTIAEADLFQISGEYLTYDIAGKQAGSGRVVVENRLTGAVSYEVAFSQEYVRALALQQDGTLVLLGAGTSACAKASPSSEGSYPAAWFSPASPVAHQLGCFYDGSLRPVGGQWVALGPGPGSEVSLVLLNLANGSSRTLALFANAGVFELQPSPDQQPQQLTPGADFDGRQLAWIQQTCTGAALQFAPDVSAMSPGPLPSPGCPMLFHIHRALRPTAKGAVRVAVSCPQGCPDVELSIAQPRGLREAGSAFFSLPASTAARIESLRLSRGQRAYLRRHRRVRIALVALSSGLGSAPQSRSVAHALLVR